MEGPRLEGVKALMQKCAAGDALDEKERTALQAYRSKYAPAKINLHLKKGRRQEWQVLAQAQGVALSSWIQERVVEALAGESDAVSQLRLENQRLRDELAGMRGSHGAMAVENHQLHTRIENLEGSLMQAMSQALELAA